MMVQMKSNKFSFKNFEVVSEKKVSQSLFTKWDDQEKFAVLISCFVRGLILPVKDIVSRLKVIVFENKL